MATPYWQIFIVVSGSLFITPLALGNGGGYQRGVASTGNPALFEATGTEHVQIVREDLDIRLESQKAHVAVRYTMRHTGENKVTARFGFPVEEMHVDLDENGNTLPDELKQKLGEKPLYCKTYSIKADGKEIKAKFQKEPTPAENSTIQYLQFDKLKGWLISEVSFPPKSARQVEITYTSDYDISSEAVSDDSRDAPNTFRYRLSTGAIWGGPIASGTVRVKAGASLDQKVISIQKPLGKFTPSPDGGWQWDFSNLEPTLADDIEIHTSLAREWRPAYGRSNESTNIGYEKLGDVWRWHHYDYAVTASSTLASADGSDYTSGGVRDRIFQDEERTFRAWVEGKADDGIGETLTLTPKMPLPLEALRMQPGYGKNDALFKANNRPKMIKVTLNDSYSFKAALKDENALQMIPIPDYSKPVETIKIELAAVYAGEKYDDTAISDIRLISRLSKEPKFQAAR